MSDEESKEPMNPTKNVIALSLNDRVEKVLENAREAGRLSRKMELLDGVATTRVRMTSMLLRKLMVLSMSDSER